MASPARAACPSAPACGTALAQYRGVTTHSNGRNQCTGESCGGNFKWQCVEFADRFGRAILGAAISPIGTAKNIFANPPTGYKAIANGSPPGPAPNDLIILDATSSNPFGHVGVITAVTGTSVATIEQNYSITGVFTYGMSNNFIATRGGAKVLGWVRRVAAAPSATPTKTPTKTPTATPTKTPPRTNTFTRVIQTPTPTRPAPISSATPVRTATHSATPIPTAISPVGVSSMKYCANITSADCAGERPSNSFPAGTWGSVIVKYAINGPLSVHFTNQIFDPDGRMLHQNDWNHQAGPGPSTAPNWADVSLFRNGDFTVKFSVSINGGPLMLMTTATFQVGGAVNPTSTPTRTSTRVNTFPPTPPAAPTRTSTPPVTHTATATTTPATIAEICDGIDNDGDQLVDEYQNGNDCWVSIYRFAHPAGNRCWSPTSSPPSVCSAYNYERVAFIVARYPVTGTFPLAQCSRLNSDNILLEQGSGDYTTLRNAGYTCSFLGYAFRVGSAPVQATPFGRACRAYRASYSTTQGWAHFISIGADSFAGMTPEPPARFEAYADGFGCFATAPF